MSFLNVNPRFFDVRLHALSAAWPWVILAIGCSRGAPSATVSVSSEHPLRVDGRTAEVRDQCWGVSQSDGTTRWILGLGLQSRLDAVGKC